ncbi:acyltransferase domain-containing protein [Nonomuraea antimicrobica]|uniref:Acyltransferase domain-containing protein n=1 Tax=Nonomuraea antimicrobica TaxID=561173 RepID=A0ABP7EBS1_9ACTN
MRERHPAGERPVVFMFPGVGDHYAGMSQGLYEHEPAFRASMDRCFGLLTAELGQDVRALLYPGEAPRRTRGRPDVRALLNRGARPPAGLDRTRVLQPLVFSVEYALAELLMSWGIEPAGLLGYSIGEYVAACVAGVLPLDQALALVVRRADLIETLPAGAMLVVLLGEDELTARLGDDLSLAAVDGERLCVAAGPVPAVERLERDLAAAGVAHLRVGARHAFHSRMMAPIEPYLEGLARTFTLRPPAIPFLSNVTGAWITAEQATDPRYWAGHLHRTVRFHDGLTELWAMPSAIALEVGVGTMLTGLADQHPDRPDDGPPSVFPTLAGGDDVADLLAAVEGLRAAGARVDRDVVRQAGG